jgi:hypothetical protein
MVLKRPPRQSSSFTWYALSFGFVQTLKTT